MARYGGAIRGRRCRSGATFGARSDTRTYGATSAR